jgi:hypothetical protein
MTATKAIYRFCGVVLPSLEFIIFKIINPDRRAAVQEQFFYAHPDCFRTRLHGDAVLPVLAGRGETRTDT